MIGPQRPESKIFISLFDMCATTRRQETLAARRPNVSMYKTGWFRYNPLTDFSLFSLMMNAGMMTRRNGRIGERMLVPATVEPFFPLPPLLNILQKIIRTMLAVTSENDAIMHHSGSPNKRVSQNPDPKKNETM